jgi:hypothetical protein
LLQQPFSAIGVQQAMMQERAAQVQSAGCLLLCLLAGLLCCYPACLTHDLLHLLSRQALTHLHCLAACRNFLLSTFAGLLQLTIHGAKNLKAVNVSGGCPATAAAVWAPHERILARWLMLGSGLAPKKCIVSNLLSVVGTTKVLCSAQAAAWRSSHLCALAVDLVVCASAAPCMHTNLHTCGVLPLADHWRFRPLPCGHAR